MKTQKALSKTGKQWRWCGQTNKDNSEKKKIRELEKEAAYERLHSYSTKKYQVHGGLVTDVKELN